MKKLTKNLLLVILIIGGILVATGVYISSHPVVQESSGSIGNPVPEPEDNITIPNDTVNLTQNETIPQNVVFNGQSYSVINKELTFVGPSSPICPYCGSSNTIQTGSSSRGKYWFYYYHCNTCKKNFANYADSYG
ncbi:MAG TPA: hypothetical protein VK444_07865 [Methanobacteriaceae archaeon]|nr:hypothetical protein [Methanobacteriaceae archaeon]